jgi:hypothetical protein
MELRTFSVISALGMLALSACVINTTPSPTGGSGGSAGSDVGSGGTGGSAGSGSSSSSSGGGMGGGGGAGGGGMCTMCCSDQAIGNGVACPGSSAEMLWNSLATCACDMAAGKCAMQCGDNRCMGGTPSATCTECITNAQTGCGNELAACSNDTANCLP